MEVEVKHESTRLSDKSDMRDSFACPVCHRSLQRLAHKYECRPCAVRYPDRGEIPCFSENAGYWCNVDQNRMHRIIDRVRSGESWKFVVESELMKIAQAMVPLHRGDAQFLFPIDGESVVLDAGAMWGGLTIPISQYCKKIYAVDQTWETLELLRLRCEQENRKNVEVVVSPIKQLPFPDDFFDFVVLNGVLEWLGLEQDVVLDDHWQGQRQKIYFHSKNADELQLEALKELRRVLKPTGSIYCAIENRIGIQYFFGHPDDHMNIRYVTFMPRWYANLITKYVRKTEYRTYVYTPNQLNDLFERSGFMNNRLFTVYPHYGKISRIVPYELFEKMKRIATEGYNDPIVYLMTQVWKIFPSRLGKMISPSLAIIGSKCVGGQNRARAVNMLERAGVLTRREGESLEALLVNNRFANRNPVHLLLLDKINRDPKYFMKISRSREDSDLIEESNALAKVNSLFEGSKYDKSTPQLVAGGSIEGIKYQLTRYSAFHRKDTGIWNNLRKLGNIWKTAPKPLLMISSAIGRWTWLRQNHDVFVAGLLWLCEFQKRSYRVVDKHEVKKWVDLRILRLSKALKPAQIEQLKHNFDLIFNRDFSGVGFTWEHGDFDICNVFIGRGEVFIVDFEHFSAESLPFFDLANFILSPVVAEWKAHSNDCNLDEYINATPWKRHLEQWITLYASESGIDRRFLSELSTWALLLQNSKDFGPSRNPHDYPLYGSDVFDQVLRLKL